MMIDKKGWNEFRNTGLLLFVNMFLHIFGWTIVLMIDSETGKVLEVYPAKTDYKGFSEVSTRIAYNQIEKMLSTDNELIVKDGE